MIDINKTYKTKSGLEVRIYATDLPSPYEVHGAIKDEDGTWNTREWTIKGNFYHQGFANTKDNYDLIEVKPKIKGWVHLLRNEIGMISTFFATKKVIDPNYSLDFKIFACIEIEFEENEGL